MELRSGSSPALTSALVVEGGAMRSVFSAGLLDGFLHAKFDPFDFYIGVSGGAYNLAAFLAGTPGRSLRVYDDYALRRPFISYRRFLRGGHLLDLDWMFQVTQADRHFDAEEVFRKQKPLIVCATEVSTGAPVYMPTAPHNLLQVLKATMALPLFYRDFPAVDGRPMSDGGIADGIPVAEAIRRGAKRVLVVRSRPPSYVKTDTPFHRFIRWQLRDHVELTRVMAQRVERHTKVLDLIHNPPEGVRILEVCTPEEFSVGRFSRDREALLAGYARGVSTANTVIRDWYALGAAQSRAAMTTSHS